MNKLNNLLSAIDVDKDDLISVPSGGGGLPVYEFDIDPYEFLLQAEMDYEAGGNTSDLNVITNAKRAIVSQMDQALLSFGYPATKWNIPRKIEVLNKLGLVAPRIIKKVSKPRNLLEHEYLRPDVSQIEEALDLALLFVASIKPTLAFFPDEFVVGNKSKRKGAFTFEKSINFTMMHSEERGMPTFSAFIANDTGRKVDNTISSDFTYLDEEFSSIVKLALATDRDFRKDIVLDEFIEAAGLN